MYLFSNNPGNRTTRNIIALIVILLFVTFHGITSTASAADLDESVNPDTENSGLKWDSSNEGDIVAEVDGRSISTGELLKQYNLYYLMSSFSRTYEKGLSVNSYLDRYISELLLLHKADDMGTRVTMDEAENEKKNFLKLFRMSDETLSKWLNLKSLTVEDAVIYLKNRLIMNELCRKLYGVKEVTSKEVMAYYKENNIYYNRPAKIKASHILICHHGSRGCKSNLSKDQAKELAEEIRKTATPENFAGLAKQYSYDRTGEEGGSLGVITEGSAAPSFEKAAFSLEKGGISDVVETPYGYHIIYVSDKLERLSIPLEEAEGSIRYTLQEKQINSELLKYSEQLKKNAKISKFEGTERKGTIGKSPDTAQTEKSPLPVKKYSTFKSTGKGINKNSKGQPIIILFTRKGCHYCEWIEDTFDDVVTEYVKKGLIEAHHYDYITKDDYLTPEVETEIPPEYLKLFEIGNPNSGTPYFNFGGMYARAGTGYFEQDDLYAEEMEMTQIIDDLLR